MIKATGRSYGGAQSSCVVLCLSEGILRGKQNSSTLRLYPRKAITDQTETDVIKIRLHLPRRGQRSSRLRAFAMEQIFNGKSNWSWLCQRLRRKRALIYLLLLVGEQNSVRSLMCIFNLVTQCSTHPSPTEQN